MVELYIIGGAAALIAAVAARSALKTVWRRLLRPKVKGHQGEAKVSKTLKHFIRKGARAKNDILLETGRGTSQLDHLLITKQGLLVIETKNYSGIIHGTADGKLWTQTFPGSYSEPRQFYNPIRQNEGHISALRGILKDYKDIPIHSIVAFSDSCSFPHYPGVVSFGNLKGAIKLLTDAKPVLSDDQLKDIENIIDKNTNTRQSARTEHNYQAHLNASVSSQEMKEFIRRSQQNAVKITPSPAAHDVVPGQAQRRLLTDTGASLTIHGQTDTIAGFFEKAKRRNDGEQPLPGGNFDYFVCPYTNDTFPSSEALSFYQGLWITYLNGRSDLVDFLKATGPENLGNSFRCKKVFSQYLADKEAFTEQVRSSAWYQNMASKYKQKTPIDRKIASAAVRCGTDNAACPSRGNYTQKDR